MITVTFVRHGESFDNLKSVWAGWKDAPLSDLGRKQAAAAGRYFSSTKLDIIYASPLLRANATAQAIHASQIEPFPSFIVTPKLREQHFGKAEGKAWTYEYDSQKSMEELFEQDIFPVLFDRHEKFPEGESLNDLAARAEEAIVECVLPHLHAGKDGLHIALVSHGLCISELVAALLRLDPDSRRDISYAGLKNTAWTRAEVTIKDGNSFERLHVPPALDVRITHVNIADHLHGLDTVSSMDDTSSEARAFFGGSGKAAVAAKIDGIDSQKL